jgi:hypothetical protein
MFDLILCAIFKNESHVLDEWIQHYLIRGVDHIYLVNDHSTDEYTHIVDKYKDRVTLFHNDIVTKEVGKQTMIYNKYFKPVLYNATWAMILDLDEFLYSPQSIDIKNILSAYDNYNQLKVDWLHFGSNGHIQQPPSVVQGFTKRSKFDITTELYSHKTLFKPQYLLCLGIHFHTVNGPTFHFAYNDTNVPPLVINHYNVQSREFYLNVKGRRGDINNWFDHIKRERDIGLFQQYDINEVEDLRLSYQQLHPPGESNIIKIASPRI